MDFNDEIFFDNHYSGLFGERWNCTLHRKKLNEIYYTLNIVRIFANNIQDMEEKKDYTVTQEQLARFAKALGHPARIAIMHFFGKAEKRVISGIFTKSFPLPKATVSPTQGSVCNSRASSKRIGFGSGSNQRRRSDEDYGIQCNDASCSRC